MDRETAVKLWHATTGGGPLTGRIVELFATAVESLERERCAQQFVENGREIGRQEERERLDVKAGACVEALRELDKRLRECSAIPASAADAYDSFYRDMVLAALKAVG